MAEIVSKNFKNFSDFKRNHSILAFAIQIGICIPLVFLVQCFLDKIANQLLGRRLSLFTIIFVLAVFSFTALFSICFPRREFGAIWRRLPDLWVRIFAVTTLALLPITGGILADHAMRIFDWYTLQSGINSPPTIAIYTVYDAAIIFVILSSALYSFREKFLKISANIEAEVHNKPYDILIIALSPLSNDYPKAVLGSGQEEAERFEKFVEDVCRKLFDNINEEKMKLLKDDINVKNGGGADGGEIAKLSCEGQARLLGFCCAKKEKGAILSCPWQQPIRVIRHFINNRKNASGNDNRPLLDKLRIIVFATNKSKIWYDNFVKLFNDVLEIDSIEFHLADTLDEGNYNKTVKLLKDSIEHHYGRFSKDSSRRFGIAKRVEPRICIDITSGIKEWSVAAAVVTLNKSLNFCYMNNQTGPDPNAILYYDAHISGSELGL